MEEINDLIKLQLLEYYIKNRNFNLLFKILSLDVCFLNLFFKIGEKYKAILDQKLFTNRQIAEEESHNCNQESEDILIITIRKFSLYNNLELDNDLLVRCQIKIFEHIDMNDILKCIEINKPQYIQSMMQKNCHNFQNQVCVSKEIILSEHIANLLPYTVNYLMDDELNELILRGDLNLYQIILDNTTDLYITNLFKEAYAIVHKDNDNIHYFTGNDTGHLTLRKLAFKVRNIEACNKYLNINHDNFNYLKLIYEYNIKGRNKYALIKKFFEKVQKYTNLADYIKLILSHDDVKALQLLFTYKQDYTVSGQIIKDCCQYDAIRCLKYVVPLFDFDDRVLYDTLDYCQVRFRYKYDIKQYIRTVIK